MARRFCGPWAESPIGDGRVAIPLRFLHTLAPPPSVSLRLGHARALTTIQVVIHSPRAASLPPGGGQYTPTSATLTLPKSNAGNMANWTPEKHRIRATLREGGIRGSPRQKGIRRCRKEHFKQSSPPLAVLTYDGSPPLFPSSQNGKAFLRAVGAGAQALYVERLRQSAQKF